MAYTAHYLTISEFESLHDAYKAHGNSFQFWHVYQQLQTAAISRTTDCCTKVANEMAKIAEEMGAIQHALLL